MQTEPKAVSDIRRRIQQLEALRQPAFECWRDVLRYVSPVLGQQLGLGLHWGTGGLQGTGDLAVVDQTLAISARQLASSLQSGLTPANSVWVSLDIGSESADERQWLDEAARVLHEAIHQSNFDTINQDALLLASAAQGIVFIDYNADDDALVFELWPVGECVLASSRADLVVDTIGRRFRRSIQQLATEYDRASLSDGLRERLATEPDALVEVVRFIEPRQDGKWGAPSKRKPFSCIDYELDTGNVLRESGYDEFPLAIARVQILPGSCYGIGPAFTALPATKSLNQLKRIEHRQSLLAVDPPLVAEDDGVINFKQMRIAPGRVIPVGKVGGIQPLEIGLRGVQVSMSKANELVQQIQMTMMVDHLRAPEIQMTATEVNERMHLARQIIGPVFSGLQSSYCVPLIERVFGIAIRAGWLGPADRIPHSIQGRTMRIRSASPIARAQKMEDVGAIQQFEAGLANLIQIAPDVMDLYDVEKGQRYKADALGVPLNLLRSVDDLAKLRDAKQQAAQAQQQTQMEQQAASTGLNAMASEAGKNAAIPS